MSKAMSMGEFGKLLEHVRRDHSFCRQTHGRYVKYIDPHIDTRTWQCFAITFRGGDGEITLHTQNECRDLPESLYERCMAWLDREPRADDK